MFIHSDVVLRSVEEPKFTENRGSNYDKLKDTNQKLKNELRALAQAADKALQNERMNRANRRPKETEDGELRGCISLNS